MSADGLTTPIARHIWETRYRYPGDGEDGDRCPADTWRRVARALAAVEPHDRSVWEERFFDSLAQLRFLPGGRILAGAGTHRRITLFNCFVMGTIEDSMDGIFEALKEGALTMQQGGGVGYDFSTLRPAGSQARSGGTIASGPVSFMRVWDSMCETLISTGNRRGAMMGALRCDHPDIEAFIEAKSRAGALTNFNLSVQVTDAFVEAAQRDDPWPLVFPAASMERGGAIVRRRWTGTPGPVDCVVVRTVPARALWQRLARCAWATSEPGVLFVDRINALNNLWYAEHITATNPCGEVPLPPYGACDLGSVNLTAFVRRPFEPDAWFDLDAVRRLVPVAVRLMDDAIDASRFPLEAQARVQRSRRRIGLGITGLADALLMLGLRYGSPEAARWAGETMRAICESAYAASVDLAKEKGAFELFDRDAYLSGKFVARLPARLRDAIARHGIRNSHLLSIAPTGTISLLAGGVSTGVEPIVAADYERVVLDPDGSPRRFEVTDPAVALWRRLRGRRDGVPPAWVDAADLGVDEHLAMQAALQRWVDNAISKTLNLPADTPWERLRDVYEHAWALGLKGCTVYRPTAVRGAVVAPTHPSSAEDSDG